jgi:hypothetical protein
MEGQRNELTAYVDAAITEEDGEEPSGENSDTRSDKLMELLASLSMIDLQKIATDLMIISQAEEGTPLSKEELLCGPFRTKVERWVRIGLEDHIVELLTMVERTRQLVNRANPDEAPVVAQRYICQFLCISI